MVLVLILGGFLRLWSGSKVILVGPIMWCKVFLGGSGPDFRWFSEVLQ